LWLLTVERIPNPNQVARTNVRGSLRADDALCRQVLGDIPRFEACPDLPRGNFRDRKPFEVDQVRSLILQELEVVKV